MNSKDEIAEIPSTMEKFFGGSGEMVRPAPKTVVSYIKKIPAGKVSTIESLRERIARKHKVHTSCPSATMKAVKEAVKENVEFGYWRLVKKGGVLLNQLPGGVKEQAKLLKKEGLEIDNSKKNPAVKNYESKMHTFK